MKGGFKLRGIRGVEFRLKYFLFSILIVTIDIFPLHCRGGNLSIRHTHHLVGNPVCLLLIFIPGLPNLELGL